MRKAMILLISSALIFSSVGCGTDTSATSDSSSATTEEVVAENLTDTAEVVEPVATEENEKLNNESSNDETKTEEPKRDKSSVKWEDYFDGNAWDLTAYAEALGYEWLPDPEYDETLAMYKIVHSDGNYFCCYFHGVVFIFLVDNNGEAWHCHIGTPTGATENLVIVSAGQEDVYVDEASYIERVAKLFDFVAQDDVDLTKIPDESYTVSHHEGTARYFDNGLIKQRELGDIDGWEIYHNTDN